MTPDNDINVLKDPEQVEVEVLSQTGELNDRQVLEIGAGEGRMTWRYAAWTASVVGIDVDPERIDDAVRAKPEHLAHKTSFLLAMAERLPFPAGSFDTAVLAWSL
jgi:ubiquinone/menaquinone biosynthesis C-methylase UbiE